jgi:hypothetical protein
MRATCPTFLIVLDLFFLRAQSMKFFVVYISLSYSLHRPALAFLNIMQPSLLVGHLCKRNELSSSLNSSLLQLHALRLFVSRQFSFYSHSAAMRECLLWFHPVFMNGLRRYVVLKYTDGIEFWCQLDNTDSVRFQVLTAANMKMTVFWDVAPCSLVVRHTTRRSNPEHSHLNFDSIF